MAYFRQYGLQFGMQDDIILKTIQKDFFHVQENCHNNKGMSNTAIQIT
jgi:hypothetical protein